ncbi:right-handed parallel beta-helix repeat-containing protein [uncultured Methanobrevibacter sp.]|uniref:right-handed parallel beta-helix repeat-containing protein n=1 Tax=uncultured Methanobrevibacter sp. TaxID=253161 RepID=UPI0025D0DEAD|nr:right-handed parallel beta-helix repeat-containing protein [uncultured Methanobrevibacter sp.]
MNKKVFIIFFICIISLFLVSSVNATKNFNNNLTSQGNFHKITNESTNDDIQLLFDNANDGDTFEFTSKKYNNISLVVDKKLNIVSKVGSVVNVLGTVSTTAQKFEIDKTFGFYFTQNSGGSILSGITIISGSGDYGVIVDSSDNVIIKNNVVIGGQKAGMLIKNSDHVTVSFNSISKSNGDGLQLHDVGFSNIKNNTISYNKRSGIETSNINNNSIFFNVIHHNVLNGITLQGRSYGNLIKHNDAYENLNGIFINSTSSYDVINANSFTSNRKNPSIKETGGVYETGNGLLFGSGFKTLKENTPGRLEVRYNVLAHNEMYQAKNNPDLPVFKLGDNWFDSTDDSDTFVCPMLLAGIMKMGTISVKNGIGLQMYDTKGKAVKEFGTFDTKVKVNGNQYTAKFVNGKAIIEANLDPDKEYDIEVMIGGKPIKYKYKVASGEKDDSKDSKTSDATDGNRGSSGSSSQISTDNAAGGVAKGNSQNGNSKSAHYSNNKNLGAFGMNASGSYQDSSDNGQNSQTKGDINSGDASNGEVSEEGKAYEIVPPSKISNEVTDTSGLVVLSIVSIMGMLVYGYWRKEDFE